MRIELHSPILLTLLAGGLLVLGHPARGQTAPTSADVPGTDAAAMSSFLDRLMRAESSGNDLARNPRSTAVGAFQFIEATFLDVVARHFSTETAGQTPAQILALRTNRAFARRAAEAYTIDNAGRLAAAGLKPTFAHLRLAYLVGPAAAVRVLRMPPQASAALVLGPAVIRANPFLAGYTTADLVARAARDVDVDPAATAGVTPRPGSAKASGGPALKPACNLMQASCRRWLALAERRVGRGRRASQ